MAELNSGPILSSFFSKSSSRKRTRQARACASLLPNVQSARVACGRSMASYNNLVFNEALGIDQTRFGAADTTFPRLTDPGVPKPRTGPAGFPAPARRPPMRRPAVSCSMPIRASSPT